MTRSDELEAFKTQINMVEYAAHLGFEIDRKTSRNWIAMNGPGGKILISMAPDNHWVYCPVGDKGGGSIIDLDQQHNGGDISDVRKRLRGWINDPSLVMARMAKPPCPVPSSIARDILRVCARLEAMERADGRHPYLQQERRIPGPVLAAARFADRIFIDQYRNAIFPHRNRAGICGYEIKNRDFTGFAAGGEKGLWSSRTSADDRALVIAETAIDALSYHALKLPELTRYISTAGALNNTQPDLIRSAIEKMPVGSKIILAVDNDEGGDSLAEKITGIYDGISHPGGALLQDRPARRGADWNDILKSAVNPRPRVAGSDSSCLPAPTLPRH
ncbi:MAG TPA: DUF3991 and TOPRIM domain-containing protein [Chthoniobacterales bacterium]